MRTKLTWSTWNTYHHWLCTEVQFPSSIIILEYGRSENNIIVQLIYHNDTILCAYTATTTVGKLQNESDRWSHTSLMTFQHLCQTFGHIITADANNILLAVSSNKWGETVNVCAHKNMQELSAYTKHIILIIQIGIITTLYIN